MKFITRDTTKYIGLNEMDAINHAKQDGFFDCHILYRDGIMNPMSSSLNECRVAFTLKNDFVVKAEQG
jgi:hypothetical protein